MMKPARLLPGLRDSCKCLSSSSRPLISTPRSSIPSSRRAATTTTENSPIRAAAPIRFRNEAYESLHTYGDKTPVYARVLPESPAYFSASPIFTDNLLRLRELESRYSSLPRLTPGSAPRVAWRSLVDYKNTFGEEIQATKYQKLVEILNRLNHIHPSLMPGPVTETLNHYKRDINPYKNVTKPAYIDALGRSLGVGRRKASSARAWLVEGTGEVLVNGKSLAEYFGRIHDRESVIWALKSTERIAKYNIWALVQGGGTTGQAEALTLAVGKALMAHEPALKPALRRAGCVTRDRRRVERKKPGHVKARKMPAWVKR